jgi:hypothetical protein
LVCSSFSRMHTDAYCVTQVLLWNRYCSTLCRLLFLFLYTCAKMGIGDFLTVQDISIL